MTIFSKPRIFFFIEMWIHWFLNCYPNAYKHQWAWVDTSSRGIVVLASIRTEDLHMLLDVPINVPSTTVLRLKTIDGPPRTSSWNFCNRSFYPSVKGWSFAWEDFCRQVMARFGIVKPSFNISIYLPWLKPIILCIASKIGTTSLLLCHRKKCSN